MSEVEWFALYVRSRAEKKVAERLQRKGFEVFSPLKKVMKQWSDRKKLVEEPYFRGYVFVKFAAKDKLAILHTEGVVQIVHWLGKAAAIREEEMQAIQEFFQKYDTKDIQTIDFKIGQQLHIDKGPFKDFNGVVVDQNKKQVSLRIQNLQIAFIVTVDRQAVNPNPASPLN